MSKDKDKDNQEQAWMHYSGAKEGWEKMMNGAPSLSDYAQRRGVDPEDVAGSEGFAKAQAMHAAKMASGAWMTETVNLSDFDLTGKKGAEPIYKHPHLAKMAKKGYTFDQIQQAGNNLGIKSFNSQNDADAITEYLENHYNPKAADENKKEEDDGPIETTPEEQERYDAIRERLQKREDYQVSQQEKGMKPLDRYANTRDFSEFSDRQSYDARNNKEMDKDMKNEAKDPEAYNFLNTKKKDTINRMRADEANRD